VGFELFRAQLDAYDFGVAQRRRRLFVIGILKDPNRPVRIDSLTQTHPAKRKTVRDAIGGLPEPVTFSETSVVGLSRYHPNHWCMTTRSSSFATGELSIEKNHRGRSFRVLAWDKPSYTIAYGNREVHVHPSGKRRLSVLEAMLLQGFPHNYELLGNLGEQFRMVSDAVPPPLARAIGTLVRQQLVDR
jgi:DNA (cytosine-5)-methyltransferase 1